MLTLLHEVPYVPKKLYFMNGASNIFVVVGPAGQEGKVGISENKHLAPRVRSQSGPEG